MIVHMCCKFQTFSASQVSHQALQIIPGNMCLKSDLSDWRLDSAEVINQHSAQTEGFRMI